MIRLKPATVLMICALLAAMIGYMALELVAPVALGKDKISDYDVFYLVSTMIREGNLYAAYDPQVFLARQPSMPGYDGTLLIWSYPPPFDLVVAPLSLVPDWLGYILFMGGTLTAYLLVLRKIAGENWHAVLVAFLPLIALILRAGQNSFLIGTLFGLSALLALRKSRWAGVPLGLMAIKPHLAPGVGLWALLDRRWSVVAISLCTVAAVCGLATLAFGTGVWPAALDGIRGTGQALHDGGFILYRMSSVYALAASLGAGPKLALALHGAVALSALVALLSMALTARTGVSGRVFMAAGIFLSCLISPYNYDYDLAMLGIAAAMLSEGIAARATRAEKVFLMVGFWIIGGYGLIASQIESLGYGTPPALSGLILTAVGVCLWRITTRGGEMTEQVARPETLALQG